MTAEFAPRPLATVASFDHEVDVLVVGYGGAGAAAAYEAAITGASVLVLERAGAPGGSSALSGGELYLGGGTRVQKACGFEDDADNMFSYLRLALGPFVDEEKLRVYCDGSVEHFEWFAARGVEFEESLYENPAWVPPTRDGLMWLGENAWPYNTVARAVPRGHRPATEGHGGWKVMEAIVASCRAAGVEEHVNTRVTALVADEYGGVVGATAQQFGVEISYRARRSVVVTTGGFVDNTTMVADHAPYLLGHYRVSDGLDDGSGIQMATALGAATRRMGSHQMAYTALPAAVCRGMLVNGLGQRFINEDVYPGLYGQAALHQPGPCWNIIDEVGYESIPAENLDGVFPSHVTETLEELEQELGVPVGSLQTTVTIYNTNAEAGEDLLFHKDPRWLRPLVAPFAAIDPRIGFSFDSSTPRRIGTGFAGFTLGGLHTTPDGHVLDLGGEAIPGLFAAGRASSSMHGQGYISGTSVGDVTFFGRRCGRTAARLVS